MRERITRNRPLTAEEKLKYGEIRQQVADELPEIKRRAQVAKPRILLKHVLHALKQERERRGLSLTEVNEKTGIDRESLTKMENDLDPNVTVDTLLRYAGAIGKTLTVQVDDYPGTSCD
jgi:DNA-binding Xre family transcriptional regulator